MQELTRRAAIASDAAAANASTVPAGNASPTPIARLWAERERSYAEKMMTFEREEKLRYLGETSAAFANAARAYDEASDRVDAIDDAIMEAPVVTLADLSIKARVMDSGFVQSEDRVERLVADVQTFAARATNAA